MILAVMTRKSVVIIFMVMVLMRMRIRMLCWKCKWINNMNRKEWLLAPRTKHCQARSSIASPQVCSNQQPGSPSSPSQQADLNRDAQPPAGVDLPSASSTLQQPATGSLQAPTQITQQADVNQLSRPSAAVQEATAPGVDVPSYPALSRLNKQDLYKQELSLARATKVICSLDLLLEVFKKCQKPTCKNDSQVKYHLVGPTVVINWTCPAGHKGKFCSSRDANDMKANNLQAAAAIMLS